MKGLRKLLEDLRNGKVQVDEVLEDLKFLPYKDLGHTKIDTHRKLRRGQPEAVYCEGKSKEQIVEILEEFPEDQTVIATRASKEVYDYVKQRIESVVYHDKADLIQVGGGTGEGRGLLTVVSAGTSDEKIAEECAVTAEIMGNNVNRIYDVGISGVHRLFSNLKDMDDSKVIVVVAGMEGALPGLVAGLVSVPVIGVPTSVGYGVHLDGMAPLLTMLNSCSPGLSVVNINNGYGAAYIASLINKESSEKL